MTTRAGAAAMATRVLAPAVVAAGVLASAAAAPVAPQQFRSGAQTVAVYTTVLDNTGRLVTDLPRDAFEVYDNGRPQAITNFANDIQPITIAVLLDRSASMLRNFHLVQEAAGLFVDQLLPQDKARIGSFSDRVQLDPRDFTSDHVEMRRILETELQPPGPTPLWNAVGVGMTALLHQDGRRVVLVFTDGMDEPLNGSPYNLSLRGVMKRAEDEDVMVYAIGLAGNPAGYGFGGGGFRGYGARGRGADRPDPGLQKLAAASGGGYFELISTRDLGGTFARVAEELHHQYLIGFVPEKLDGKVHKLDVRLTNPAMTARARRSYVARQER